MYPVLFKIGPATIYSFGFMMALAFLAANYLFAGEAKRRGWDQKHVSRITIIALVGGVAGSKLFSIFEDWSEFLRDPIHTIFSPSGLTFYGGFILAGLGILLYIRKQKISFRQLADIVAPTVLIAYGIGRIGCQLAGDGDYGIPTHAAWGTIYAQGTAKPMYVLLPYFEQYPEERIEWKYDSLKSIPAGIDGMGQRITRFDEVTPCHPTPIYEFLAAALAFAFLWSKRKQYQSLPGKLFGFTLIAMGVERFLVEFMRINPLYAGLSMAQWISVALVVLGVWLVGRVFNPSSGRVKNPTH